MHDGSSTMTDQDVVRRLARDHWVRMHGTPRLTVLVGGERARSLWLRWADVASLDTTLFDAQRDAEVEVQRALDAVMRDPTRSTALVIGDLAFRSWRSRANDRDRALVDEGTLFVDDENAPPSTSALPVATSSMDARSIAESVLFEALESTPATKGRFELNGYLSVRFGADAAEVDLLGRQDRIAIEIDGYHHFTDADAYRRDRRKDVLLQSQGLFVIRVLAEDVVRDPKQAVNMVCQAIASRPEHR
jgi:hypothetical protein